MTRPLSFQQIQAFRAVVISGTTVAAAHMLHTTQPSISRLIAQAQSATGLKLFVNDRGRLQLTREGRHLFESIQQHFRGLEHIEQTVTSLRASGSGTFRIACTPALAQSILPPAMRRFAATFPKVRYHLATLGSREIYEGLRLGMYDIAITNTRFEGNEFTVHVLDEAPAVCICALEHDFAHLDVVSLSNFQDEVFLGLPEHDELTQRVREALAREQVAISCSMETLYSATICALAAEGLGVSVMNRYVASVFKDHLCIRRLAPEILVATYATFARYAPASELADHFLDALRNAIRLGDWSSPGAAPLNHAPRRQRAR